MRLPSLVRRTAATLVALGAITLSADAAGAQTAGRKYGDVNNDGNVSAVDALAVLNKVVGLADASGFDSAWGDSNCDGVVNSLDAQIIVSHAAGLDVAAFCVNKVATARVALVTVESGTGQVMVGGTLQLTATPRDSANVALAGVTVSWASSNTSRATVSSSGLVTGVAAGEVTITATADGKSTAVPVTVIAANSVVTLEVSPRTITVLKDSSVTIAAAIKDAAGNPVAGRTITWTVEKSAIVSVTSSGVVKGLALGTSKVYATSNTQKDSAIVTVTASGATATRTWTGATSTDWGTAGNWNPASVPAVTDTVYIPAAPTNQPVMATGVTIAGLDIQAGAKLTVGTNELQVTGRADVHGEVLGTGRLVMQGVSTRESYLRGKLPNLRIIGTTVVVGPINVTGELEITPNSLFAVNGYTVNVSSNLSVRGWLGMTSSTSKLDVNGSARFFNDASTTQTALTAGTLHVAGNFTVVVPGAAAAPFYGAGTFKVVLDGASQQFVRDSGLAVVHFQELDVANTAGGIVFEAPDTARYRVVGRMTVLTGTSISGTARVNVWQNYTQAAGGSNTLRNLAVGRAFTSGANFKPDTLTIIGPQALPAGAAYQYQTVVAASGVALSGRTTTAGSVIIGCLTVRSDCGAIGSPNGTDGLTTSGSVAVSGQKLVIGKDLRQAGVNTGPLAMQNGADTVIVSGSVLGPVFATTEPYFTVGQGTWSAGVLRFGGHVHVNGAGASGTHLAIFDGKAQQELKAIKGFSFQALTISDSAGVLMNDAQTNTPQGTVNTRAFTTGVKGDFNITTPVKLTGTARLEVAGNVQTVTGSGVEVNTITVGQTLQAAGTFTPDTVVFTNTGTAQTIQNLPNYKTVRVSGKAAFGGSVTLQGSLIVDPGAELNMESRHVTVTKNALIGGILRMQDARDTLTVLGDSTVFRARNDPAVKNYATAGVLRTTNRLISDSTGFYPTGSHRTIWSPKTARSAFKTANGTFHHLDVVGQFDSPEFPTNKVVTLHNVHVKGNLTATAGATRIMADSLFVTGNADLTQPDTVTITVFPNDTLNASVITGNLSFRNLVTNYLQVKGNVTVADGGMHSGLLRYFGTWTELGAASIGNSRAALATVGYARFVQQPTQTKLGTFMSPPVTVEILTPNGVRVNGVAAVTISGTGIATQRVLTVNGIATFSNIAPTSAGGGRFINATVIQGSNYLQNTQSSNSYVVDP